MIIEQVSGMSYEQFIQEQIFHPLGMKHSHYMSNAPIIPKRASGYMRSAQGFRNANYLSMTQPYSAGSLGSTIDDLVLWDQAVRQHRLVSAETQALLFTPIRLADGTIANDGYGLTYGYGWVIDHYRGHRFVQFDGGIEGFSSFFLQFLDEPVTMIFWTNVEDFDMPPLLFRMVRHILGLPELVCQPITLSPIVQERMVGKYLINSSFR